MLLLIADVAPFNPLDPTSETGFMIWIAGGFLALALVLAILWMRRPKSPED